MAYEFNKEGELIFSGFEKGIAPSPHQGVANLQGVNLQTEMGEVMCSYNRVKQSQTGTVASNQTAAQIDASHLSSSFALINGQWITISDAGTTGISTGDYYVKNSNGTASGGAASSFQLSSTYTGSVIGGINAGTITFNLKRVMGVPVQAATEQYTDSTNVTQYRYYVLDTQGLLWVYDTAVVNTPSQGVLLWFLPDPTFITGVTNSNASGLAVFNGYIHAFAGSTISVKETVLLGVNNAGSQGWDNFTGGNLNSLYSSFNSHFAIVTQANTLTYCDGAFLGTIQSSSNSGSPAAVPIWSYGVYTFSSTTLTITDQIGGSNPVVNSTITLTTSGTMPTGVDATTLYYVKTVTTNGTATTMTIASSIGGSAISLSGGSGTQYFNTYKPSHSSGNTTYIFSPQALTLPFTAVSQSICEIGSTVVIGCQSNILYFWDEFSPLAGGFIPLPENGVKYLLNVNNMAYIFAGNKGNIYITNGSTASAAISVPDYTAGVPGTQSSYIEPYFTWGGAAYIRGRVYFSIQDQTASKAGNCGGIWSFVPTQNLFIGQDVGLALRMEAQNSYGNYNGVANVILNSQNQAVNGPQYWSFWTSSVSSPAYGIDFSDTVPFTGGSIIETDIAETGTVLGRQQQTFSNIEIRLAAPLASGESVAVNYRKNLTDAWASAGTVSEETSNPLSVIVSPLGFEKTQWLQLQAILTSTLSNPSFNRVTEIRVRP